MSIMDMLWFNMDTFLICTYCSKQRAHEILSNLTTLSSNLPTNLVCRFAYKSGLCSKPLLGRHDYFRPKLFSLWILPLTLVIPGGGVIIILSRKIMISPEPNLRPACKYEFVHCGPFQSFNRDSLAKFENTFFQLAKFSVIFEKNTQIYKKNSQGSLKARGLIFC